MSLIQSPNVNNTNVDTSNNYDQSRNADQETLDKFQAALDAATAGHMQNLEGLMKGNEVNNSQGNTSISEILQGITTHQRDSGE